MEGEKIMADLRVVIGEDLNGNEVSLDLDACMLITGGCARGKTNTVYNILDGLLEDSDVVVDIVDLRGIEYNNYSSARVNVVTNIDDVDVLLSEIIDDIYYRRDLCLANDCISIDHYNKLGNGAMPKRLLVIDELNYLKSSVNKSLFNKLTYIYSCCRAFGIYVIATSQIDRVDSIIMSNSSYILEFPDAFNRYLTKKLYASDSDIDNRVYKKGYGVLLVDGSFKVVNIPLAKVLVK